MCSCVISIAKKVFCDLKSKYIKKDRGFLPEIYSGFLNNYAYGGESDGLLNFLLFISKSFTTKGNENMKTKKLLSLILAVIMIMSVVPIYASAEDQITLTTSNIVIIPPSISPSVISYGDTWSVITITGGELYYVDEDGTEILVPGNFEHYKPTAIPAMSESIVVPFNFVPEDTTKYTSLTRLMSGRVSVKSGTWPTIAVVGGAIPTIEEKPVCNDAIVGKTWGEVTLTGGKAVHDGVEVPGTFTLKDDISNEVITAGRHNIGIKFTPDDTENYSYYVFYINIVARTYIEFVDENGNAIVPEITVSYGTKATNVNVKRFATNCSETLRYDLSANEDVILEVGTHTLEVLVSPYKTIGVTPSYLDTVLTFKVVVEPKTVPMEIKSSTDEENTLVITKVNYDDPSPQGTYDVYVNDELYAENVPGKLTWLPEKSGEYNFRVVYNPIENDPCIVEEFTKQLNKNLRRVLTRVNTLSEGSISYTYGTEVTLTENVGENFGGWKITDANGNEVDLGVDTSGVKITFTMPDFNITVEAIDKSQSSNDIAIDSVWAFFQKLIDWFTNIIKQLMNLIGLGA